MPSKTNTVKNNVVLLTLMKPEVKENYNLLIVKYWEQFEGLKCVNDASTCTSSESITRAFRSLVRSGNIQLDEFVKKNRRVQEKEYIKHYHHEKI